MFELEHRTGFEPVSQHWHCRVLPSGPTMLKWLWVLGVRALFFPAYCSCLLLTLFLVRVDRVELSPRVPRTRMLTLHHTQKNQFRVSGFRFRVLVTLNVKLKTRNSNCLPLYTNNLLDLSDNFNQVFLVLHYRFN